MHSFGEENPKNPHLAVPRLGWHLTFYNRGCFGAGLGFYSCTGAPAWRAMLSPRVLSEFRSCAGSWGRGGGERSIPAAPGLFLKPPGFSEP